MVVVRDHASWKKEGSPSGSLINPDLSLLDSPATALDIGWQNDD